MRVWASSARVWQVAGTGDFRYGEAGLLGATPRPGVSSSGIPNGSGGFAYENLGSVSTSWQIAGTGDFNGPAKRIRGATPNGGTELWNPNGSGGFTYENLGSVNTSWQIAGTGDFTGTGADGILWRNTRAETSSSGIPTARAARLRDLGAVNSSWQIAGTGDFTGTGEDSILWRNSDGGTELWNPNGSGGFTYENLGVRRLELADRRRWRLYRQRPIRDPVAQFERRH